MRQDLLFCRGCGKHFRGARRRCPNDGGPLELVQPFDGKPGDRVDDRYVLEARLGAGGMGTVWRAVDAWSGRRVALKLLNAHYATHAASARRFLHEAKLMRRIVHPGVAALHRFGPTADGALLIEMEYVAGESLRERVVRLRRGVDMELGLKVLDGLLAALAACHDVGVIHCDVKPENLMLVEGGAPGQIKLLDFGIAQPPGTLTGGEESVVLGTPAFMSPEQVRGATVDGRTDLYLVGCLAFELLTGEPPFVSDSPVELCQMQALQAAPTLASRLGGAALPPGLEDWVAALLDKEPGGRPATARVARQGLLDVRQQARHAAMGVVRPTARPTSPGRLLHRDPRAAALRAARLPGDGRAIRALIQVRQQVGVGAGYGPTALDEIAGHLLASYLDELRGLGADVIGPDEAWIDVRIAAGRDERGAIHHLLDTLGRMQRELQRIPEPALDLRAVVIGDPAHGPVEAAARPRDELAMLLDIGSDSSVRIDEHIARWAGRRPIVRLASVRDAAGDGAMTVYATSLAAYG